VGSILTTAAPLYEVLVLGKVIYGLGIALALHAAPAYLAEVGHPKIRGVLIRYSLSPKCRFIGSNTGDER
jgi:MFS family permease